MTNRTFSILLATVAICGTAMAGCSSTGTSDRSLSLADNTGSTGAKIERYLANKDYARALIVAEQFVAAAPQNGDARALLGRAYLANGRYVSARTAFTDAMTLGNRDPRTIVSLSMSQAGMGDFGAAHDLLAAHVMDLPAADYGLAMAMTGDSQEAVRALLQAVKQPEATAKTRQNLAYALAMGGAWAQARLVAGQDLSAKEAEKRLGEWGWTFLEGKPTDRVVAMIGIAPREDDAGLPTALALNESPDADEAPVQMASTDSFLESARAQLASAERPATVASEPMDLIPVSLTDPGPVSNSAPMAPSQPSLLDAAFAAPTPEATSAPKADPLREAMEAAFSHRTQGAAGASRADWTAGIAQPASDAEASDWVVQLGAFDSEAVAREKWRFIADHRAELGEFKPINSVFALNGRTFYRLAIRGFDTYDTARTTCGTLKTLGQDCFVRLDDTDATRMARTEAAKDQQLASKDGEKGKGVSLAAR